MAVSSIDTIRVQQYHDMLMQLSQQMGSRLRPAVRVETGIVGKSAYYDQLDAVAMQVKASRHTPTPINEIPHSRRRVDMVDYQMNIPLDSEDQLRLIVDPTSQYARSSAFGAGRQMDDIIIPAFDGIGETGENGGTDVSLPVGQQILETGTDSLTVDKSTQAKRILDENEVPDSDVEPRYFVTTARQLELLLAEEETTSQDYNVVRTLVKGEIDTFLGFKFIRSERLGTKAGDTTIRKNFAFSQQGILFGIGRDMTTRIDERPDLSYMVQVYTAMTMGATRMEEKRVVLVECKEA